MTLTNRIHSSVAWGGLLAVCLCACLATRQLGVVHWLAWFAQVACLMICAAVTDVRSHRIANRLTYTSVVCGVALLCFGSNLSGVWAISPPSAADAVLGAAACALVMGTFWLMRAVGGGDVKLVFALGILLGSQSALAAVLAAHVVAAVWMLCLALCTLYLPMVVSTPAMNSFASTSTTSITATPISSTTARRGRRIPMGGFYATGVLIVWCWQLWSYLS